MALQMAKLKSCLSCLCSLQKRFLYFSKDSLFLSGLVFGDALAEYSFLGFLIVFIRENSDWDNVWYDAVVSTSRDSFSAFLASFLAYKTRQRIRPLIMILVTHAILIAGMLILLFHQKSTIDGMFCLGLALLSMDISAEEYMEEFLTELAVNQSKQGTDDAKKTNKGIDAWWYTARIAGAVIGGMLISGLPRSKRLYIPAILVGIGCILIYSYSICTNKGSSGDHEVEKHELRPLLKLLPLWAPFLIYYVVDAAGSAFFGYEAYLYIIQKFSGIIVSHLIGYVITKFCGEVNQQVQQRIRLAKIIFGMLVCFLLCIDTWYVQGEGKSEDSLTFYLQFILLGIMKKMVEEMLGEYFCDQVPDQSMHHLEFTFNRFVEGMGRLFAVVSILVFRIWIGKEADDSHLDTYFRTLAFMSLWALFMFVYLSNTCYLKKETEDFNDHLVQLEMGSLSRSSRRPSESQSSPLHSSSVSQSTASFPGEKSISASSEAAALPNLESSRSSVNRDYWSIVKGYQRCHGILRYIKERSGAKEKSS